MDPRTHADEGADEGADDPSCERLRIVLLDDDADFRSALADLLRDDGHDVRDFASPESLPPLPQLAPVSILVTDYEMPQQDGLAVADDFHAAFPEAPVMLLTASERDLVRREAHRRPFLRLVHKPVRYETVHAAVHALVRKEAKP